MAKKRKSTLSDETNQLIAAAVRQGWTYDESAKGHVRLYSPDGKTIIGHSGTPSDHRAAKNFQQGEFLSVQVSGTAGTTAADIVVELDLF
jgi:hypothetical protein